MATSHTCRFARHKWTRKQGVDHLTCFRCGATRPYAKTPRCRLGSHRWVGVQKDGGDPYRECFFCRKYGGGRKDFAVGAPPT
jgi:hypothetical protein